MPLDKAFRIYTVFERKDNHDKCNFQTTTNTKTKSFDAYLYLHKEEQRHDLSIFINNSDKLGRYLVQCTRKERTIKYLTANLFFTKKKKKNVENLTIKKCSLVGAVKCIRWGMNANNVVISLTTQDEQELHIRTLFNSFVFIVWVNNSILFAIDGITV